MKQEEKIIELAPKNTNIIEMVERVPRRISSFVKEISLDHSLGNPRFLRNTINPRRFYLVYNNDLATLYDVNEKLIVNETDVTNLIDKEMNKIIFELDDSMYELHKVIRRL
ncbi:hypothetical protein [Macrococcus animalis]|uniref:hypothetical protein n=1 Tax=Macrococcus animalis TaxID=3395467 RepID=UPI0039BF355F